MPIEVRNNVNIFPVLERYDPDGFVTPSQDTKGHSAKFWFRAPEGLEAQVGIIMAARRFPYKTASDLYRHALVRHLQWLSTLEPEMKSVMSQVQVVLNLMREEQFNLEYQGVFEEVSRTVSRYLAGGHEVEARRVVERCQSEFEAMPEGFWRDQYTGELSRRFGYLMQQSQSQSQTEV